jgi:hypothetical protein
MGASLEEAQHVLRLVVLAEDHDTELWVRGAQPEGRLDAFVAA